MGKRNCLGQLDLFDVLTEGLCRGCGAVLTPLKHQGRPKVWCSGACRARYTRALPGAKEKRHDYISERHRRTYQPVRHESTCVVCGVTFKRKQRAKYCSPKCARFAAYLSVVNRGIRDDLAVKAKRKAWMDANRHRYVEANREASRRYDRENPEKARERAQRRAARTVDDRRRRRKHRQAQLKLQRAARGTTGGRVVWAHGRCHHCGETFTGKMNYAAQVPAFCSQRCSNGATKFRRRAQQAGVRLTPGRRHKVFERDGWMCQICGDPINRQVVVPAADAPTIDHRIPLAAGGAHDESNWQAAHFYCNSVKRDQVGFEFAG